MKPSYSSFLSVVVICIVISLAFPLQGFINRITAPGGLIDQLANPYIVSVAPTTGGSYDRSAPAVPEFDPVVKGQFDRSPAVLQATAEPVTVIQVTPPPAEQAVEEQPAGVEQSEPAARQPVQMEAAAAPAVMSETVVEPAGFVNGEALVEFVNQVSNGLADQVVGVFVPDVLALPIVQQPWNQVNFVSSQNNTVTQFGMPAAHGVTALLAHNYLSGGLFFNMTTGQEVFLVYGDGRIETYRITGSESYQALTPYSPYSDFINVSDASETKITSSELFNRVYTTAGQLVFQTCIEAYGNSSWGRLFVTAEKVK